MSSPQSDVDTDNDVVAERRLRSMANNLLVKKGDLQLHEGVHKVTLGYGDSYTDAWRSGLLCFDTKCFRACPESLESATGTGLSMAEALVNAGRSHYEQSLDHLKKIHGSGSGDEVNPKNEGAKQKSAMARECLNICQEKLNAIKRLDLNTVKGYDVERVIEYIPRVQDGLFRVKLANDAKWKCKSPNCAFGYGFEVTDESKEKALKQAEEQLINGLAEHWWCKGCNPQSPTTEEHMLNTLLKLKSSKSPVVHASNYFKKLSFKQKFEKLADSLVKDSKESSREMVFHSVTLNSHSLRCGLPLKEGNSRCAGLYGTVDISDLTHEGSNVDALWLKLNQEAVNRLGMHMKEHNEAQIKGADPVVIYKSTPRLNRTVTSVLRTFKPDKAKSTPKDVETYAKALQTFTVDKLQKLKTKQEKLKLLKWDYRDEMFAEVRLSTKWKACDHNIDINVCSTYRLVPEGEGKDIEMVKKDQIAVAQREAYRRAFDSLVLKATEHQKKCGKGPELTDVLKSLITSVDEAKSAGRGHEGTKAG